MHVNVCLRCACQCMVDKMSGKTRSFVAWHKTIWLVSTSTLPVGAGSFVYDLSRRNYNVFIGCLRTAIMTITNVPWSMSPATIQELRVSAVYESIVYERH